MNTDKQPARVFVVDDDASVRRALERVLRAADYDVETFASAAAYLARESYDGVGCVLLDLKMPGISGARLQQHLQELEQDIPIVFLTAHGDVPTSVSAIKHGAVDFLTKPVDDQVMFSAIEEALVRHRQCISERFAQRLVKERVSVLSKRELEVMRHVIGGALNKQVAACLGITEKTVKVHRGHVMHKMKAKSVAELVRLCDTVGIEPDQMSSSTL